MSVASLITIAANIGAPLVTSILSGRIGAEKAGLVADILGAIASAAGLPIAKVKEAAPENVQAIERAIEEVEIAAPELLALYEAELAGKIRLLEGESKEPLWVRAWRPLGMYGLGLLWIWNVMILHVINATYKIAIPAMDLSVLIQLSALYMSLYMGGHTVKAVMSGPRGAGA